MLTREQISTKLAEVLGTNPETIAASNHDNAHNVRESWNATVDRIAEFQSKYVEVEGDQGKAQQED